MPANMVKYMKKRQYEGKIQKRVHVVKIRMLRTSPPPLPGVVWCLVAYDIPIETYIYPCRPKKPVTFYGYTNIKI